MEAIEWFTAVMVASMFYGFGITLTVYALPNDMVPYAFSFTQSNFGDYNSTASEIQSSLEQQKNVPVVNVGALIFYSGNILLDMLMNAAFAGAELISIVMNGIALLLGIGGNSWSMLNAFASILCWVLYMVSVIRAILSIRSGRVV